MAIKKNIPVKYTSRDFESIKNDLIDHAKRYYAESYRDFSEASFGSLMMDTVAYVGDILSFYVDYNVNESFMDTAIEPTNISRLARQLGYNHVATSSAHGLIDLYVLVPSGLGKPQPDSNAYPILRRGSTFLASVGNAFTLVEDVDFSNPDNEVVVAKTDAEGAPTFFAVKAVGQIISGIETESVVSVGEYEKFKKIKVPKSNITEIISVVDSDGHEYYQVEYLSQDVIYKPVLNRDESTKQHAPNILKPFVAMRRFVTEHAGADTYIQFGYANQNEITNESVKDPSNIVLKRHGRNYITDISFDPSNLIETDKFGLSPSNTKLTITYRTNSISNPNTGAATITNIGAADFDFLSEAVLSNSTMTIIKESLQCNNPFPVLGKSSDTSIEEIKRRAIDAYATQGRAVTKHDYMSLIYRMPPNFGSIKRCSVSQDNDEFKRNINLYIISENSSGNLISSNSIIKENLKTWINRYKMINDTVDILDAKIVNLGIEFSLIADPNYNKFDVLAEATMALSEELRDKKFDIGEPFYITQVYRILNDIKGVLDVETVTAILKTGGSYSNIFWDIQKNKSADGRFISGAEDIIFEILLSKNIQGTIK